MTAKYNVRYWTAPDEWFPGGAYVGSEPDHQAVVRPKLATLDNVTLVYDSAVDGGDWIDPDDGLTYHGAPRWLEFVVEQSLDRDIYVSGYGVPQRDQVSRRTITVHYDSLLHDTNGNVVGLTLLQ